MLSRNNKAQRRTRRTLGSLIIIVFTLSLLPWAASSWMRHREDERVAGAPPPKAISLTESATLGGKTAASPAATIRATDACPELKEVAKRLNEEALPPVAMVYLRSCFPTPPHKQVFDRARMALQTARDKGPLTELENSLDPDTHSSEEIEAALCRLANRIDALPALEAAVTQSGTDRVGGYYEEPLDLAYSLMNWQNRCNTQEDSPEEALKRWISFARSSKWMNTGDAIQQVFGNGDSPLQEILDRFPGPVPKVLQEEVLACLPTSPDARRLAEGIQRRASSFDNEGPRPHVAKDAGQVVAEGNYLEAAYELIRLDKDNYFRRLARPPANKGMEPCRTALVALAGLPPYQASTRLAEIERAIPPQSINVRMYYLDTVASFRNAWLFAYRHDVVALVFALKEYKAAHGQYPATLDPLAPDYMGSVPVSPVTGEVPTYAIEGEGFTIAHPGERVLPLLTIWRAER